MTQGAAIFGCAGTHLSQAEAAFFRDADPWGFILFARNVADPAQLAGLCADLRDAVGWDAPILVDQEGGRVQRLRPPFWREWPPALEQAQQAGPRGMYLRARIMASELRGVGIDCNCAPLADIAGPDTHPFLRNRCYGTTLNAVTDAARATADGLLAGGVLPVLKHVPGHGRGTVDSHLDLPRVSAELEDLENTDFAAFRALSDLPMGMTAHIVFDALDADAPATQSATAMAYVRNEIRFDGLIMTDDLSMQALKGSISDRAEASIAAGCDVVLHCNGDFDEMKAVAAASGGLSDAAKVRAARAIEARHAPQDTDIEALLAELAELSRPDAHA
ncbi:glycoside hydrolase family 3 N-terminal domain-containing protein [Meridianimarinicoccus aquatilis]|uniref:beta-N-acetylhexosaminidase n=1 Tax=Meridianimarinicoccus aquatilis TaxID=2552766 RepID=A0A4V3BCH1_9RHOB|nr:glycoside hydrolase family 3 protein [Fluviibacterium aquatile]TDL90969.1 glycoside hydrolase family 3 protein [Fluviibacterium aquatile]